VPLRLCEKTKKMNKVRQSFEIILPERETVLLYLTEAQRHREEYPYYFVFSMCFVDKIKAPLCRCLSAVGIAKADASARKQKR
jgi:hypothetical protein